MEQIVFDLNNLYDKKDILVDGLKKLNLNEWKLFGQLKLVDRLEIIISSGFWIDTVTADGDSDYNNVVIAHKITLEEIRDRKIDQILK